MRAGEFFSIFGEVWHNPVQSVCVVGAFLAVPLLSVPLMASAAGEKLQASANIVSSNNTSSMRAKGKELKIAGFPAETPVSIQLPDGSRFQIPAAYLSPWPVKKEFFGATNHWRTFSFAFWMPDKRYIERNPLFLGGPRPREKGRPEPTFDQYVVGADLVSIVTEGNRHKYVMPEKMIANTKKHFSKSINGLPPRLTGETREHYGLTELITNSGDKDNFFHNDFSDNIQVEINCTNKNTGLLYQYCRGTAYSKRTNAYFSFFFTREKLKFWHNNIQAIDDFVENWKAKV